MHYLTVLHLEPGKPGVGVTVPDLPAVSSAGDSIPEALANVTEAILLYLEVLAEDGHDLPVPTEELPSVEPDQVLAVADVELAKMDPVHSKATRLNVTIPDYALSQIDQAAAAAGASRSGSITRAALTYIERKTAGPAHPAPATRSTAGGDEGA